jgi:hypothetical protein
MDWLHNHAMSESGILPIGGGVLNKRTLHSCFIHAGLEGGQLLFESGLEWKKQGSHDILLWNHIWMLVWLTKGWNPCRLWISKKIILALSFFF